MSYEGFAYVYDRLMQDVDYNKWTDYIEKVWSRNNLKPDSVLELGCGTGNITVELAKRGYNIVGMDISEDMLSIAQNKALDNNLNILFLHGNITNLNYPYKVDSVICCMDVVNYISNPRLIQKLFKNVYDYLNKDGIFIFDVRSYHALADKIGNKTFTFDSEEISYIWQNYFDEKKKISNMFITFFAKIGDNIYKKFNETHKLRCHNINELTDSLASCGFNKIYEYNSLSFTKYNENSERIFFVAKK